MFALAPEDIEVITEDGAPSSTKDFLIWKPPPVDEAAPQLGTKSALTETTALMRFLMRRGLRVILFCKVCVFVERYVVSFCSTDRGSRSEKFASW